MPRLGRIRHYSPVHVRDPLMSEAHPKDGNSGLRDHLGADSEVGRPLRSTRPRRDHDVVEFVEHVERELRPIIGHERRFAAIDLSEEVEKIERERVGVVDEQRTYHCDLVDPPGFNRLHLRASSTADVLLTGWAAVLTRHFLSLLFAELPITSKLQHNLSL